MRCVCFIDRGVWLNLIFLLVPLAFYSLCMKSSSKDSVSCGVGFVGGLKEKLSNDSRTEEVARAVVEKTARRRVLFSSVANSLRPLGAS